MSFLDELLNKTDLDEKAEAAIKEADKWLHQRRYNLKFVVSKYPVAVGVIAVVSALAGLLLVFSAGVSAR